jgi:KDO2-lipid IV(A) lauroyltransferase
MRAAPAPPPRGLRALRQRIFGRWKRKPGLVPWLFWAPTGALIALIGVLPAPAAHALGAALGRIAWLIPRRRRAGRAQLAQAMPALTPRARDRLLRRSCGHLGRAGVDIVLASRRLGPRLGEHIRWAPGAREQLAALRGKPVVAVLPHLGSVDVAGAALALAGLRPAFPMRLPSNHYTARWLERARAGHDVLVIPRHGAVRRLLAQLASGGCAVLATDQSAHHAPVFVTWFGKLAATERAAAALALRTGAPVLVFWCTRAEPSLTWDFDCELVRTAAEPAKAADEEVIALTERMHRTMERAILRRPEQYLWIHDRDRVRPAAETEHERA